jgi:starch synthase (maltosyl-transferring)
MQYLAKIGFSQSYTYFTWRNTKEELTSYFTELTQSESAEYLRPNLFANTPDILTAYLQTGGRPAFEARLVLAATLGASYGIYNGFELCDAGAVPGTEEYAESEKYQVREWDWDRPGHIKELVARVNAIRRRHRALHFNDSLQFVETDNPELIAYTKSHGDDRLLIVVNLDPHNLQHGFVRSGPSEPCDLLDATQYRWNGEWNYVRLEPGVRQGHIFQVGPRTES